MLKIGELYLQHTDGQCRLCADITLNGKDTTLWFGVDEAQGECLCTTRSDAFVMALLPAAMRGGHEIVCETPMSGRLHYQLDKFLIPILSMEGDVYREISIHAPLTAAPVENKDAVGIFCAGDVAQLRSEILHSRDTEYPVTHLLTDGDNADFAREMGIAHVRITTNLFQDEQADAVASYRAISAAMALQGLFSVFFLPGDRGIGDFSFDLHHSGAYDLLTAHCTQTESLRVYLRERQPEAKEAEQC